MNFNDNEIGNTNKFDNNDFSLNEFTNGSFMKSLDKIICNNYI